MIIGPRRMILIGAIAAIALSIILIPVIFLTTAPDFTLVEVRLSEVIMMRADDRSMELRPVFTIDNQSDQTITTSRIDYELRADGILLGSHTNSYEDIPVHGRPAVFAGDTVRIPQDVGNPYVLEFNEGISEIYNRIRQDPDSVGWSASGSALIESTLVQEILQFENRI